ncbi:DUF3025 domain-containing protein [Xenophilus sp. Marseille-Q4582]|uniref:DUF3025 domain-containing protein n=1 Tax=Xenophilus sp. Marseille-Q4582 TaxID=2866600 RepID=UPI001CE47FE1|nr:DUF3025 domain-containing protein [Xenophilus sp. Marseille-Q4582]
MPVYAALSAQARERAIRFVAHDCLPAGEAYESFIARTGTIPTRDNPHDFFNGLVWLAFPQAKRRLNDLQAAEIARRGVGPTRGPLRDALTLFDENGAVLDAPPALWEALLAREWQRLFIEQRALWRQARLLVFGHALMEKLLAGRKDATAHVLLAPPGGGAAAQAPSAPSLAPEDAAIATALQPAHLAQKPFTPLPILGVPGWCKSNEDFCFYDDPQVFRPRRTPERTTPKTSARDRCAA